MSSIAPLFQIGPRIAGSILGSTYSQYRPTSANNPISTGTLLGTLPVWITGDPQGKGSRAPDNAKSWEWFGQFDVSQTQAGDYFVGPMGTLFIASQDVPAPIRLYRCNHNVTLAEPFQDTAAGEETTYGGDQRANEISLATAWPCSILQGTKGETGSTKLPGDTKMPWFYFLLPAIPSVGIRNNLILIDDTGARYITSSTEETPLGWRITATLATT